MANFFKRLSVPTPYTVLVIFIVFAAICTWLLPAGKYNTLSYNSNEKTFQVQTQEGTNSLEATQENLSALGINIKLEKFTNGDIYKPIAVPNTYIKTDGNPQGFAEVAKAPIEGIYDAMDVILFVLIIGGFIGVFKDSGMFEAGVNWLSEKLKGRESWLIVIIFSLITLGGTTFGMAEETLAFYPILVPIFLAAGYDAVVPVAVLYGGSSIGTMCSTTNPFAAIIASDAAGVNWMEGLNLRLIMLFVCAVITIIYIMRYAAKVKKDSSKSLLFGKENNPPSATPSHANGQDLKMDTKKWILAVVFAASFVIMVIGVSRLHWWFLEMTTLFLVAAIIAGFIIRKSESKFVKSFISGAEEMLGVAIIIGIARGINIVLNNGEISDSLLYYASNLVEGMPPVAFIISLLFVFIFLTFFISSSSGLAVLTMPIMGPLGRVAGVSSEHVVNAYLMGFGIMSFVTPTGLILPSLVMVDVSIGTWLKFIAPLLGILVIVSAIFLGISVII